MTVPLRAALYLRVRRRGRPSMTSPSPTKSARAKPIAPHAAMSWSKPMSSPERRRPTTVAPSSNG